MLQRIEGYLAQDSQVLGTMSWWTVKNFRKEIYDDPLMVLRLRTVQRNGNGVFQCRLRPMQ